eukprot:6135936-Amphidinium_carterae.1
MRLTPGTDRLASKVDGGWANAYTLRHTYDISVVTNNVGVTGELPGARSLWGCLVFVPHLVSLRCIRVLG